MATLLADALVLVFTDWFSLRRWHESGQLQRDWALGDVVSQHYRRIVLVVRGHADEQELLVHLPRRTLVSGEEPPAVELAMSDQDLPLQHHLDAAPVRVAQLLADAKTVVVRTHHMAAGRTALRITSCLRRQGKKVGLFARGGYLWSRFASHEFGTSSGEAVRAANVERELCASADTFAGTTGKMVDDLAWRHALDSRKGVIVPNYVLTDGPVTSVADRTPGLLVYAGKLVRRKRVELLIQAVARLPDHVRSMVRLEIIGDGPTLPELTRLAKNLSAPVAFLPRRPHVQLLEQFRRCQIFLHASELEGHPRAVIDAMATGAPVLVADTPGLGSVIQHGATGIRVPGEPDAFATAIGELLADDDWRDMLGSAAARVTRNTFGLDRIIPLELAAHRLSLEHGSASPARILEHADTALPVRWNSSLLDADPPVAAQAWLDAVRFYTENLPSKMALDFQAALTRHLCSTNPRSEAA